MENQPDIKQVWSDPDFQGLPMEEKRKVLTNIDPDFSALPSDQQDQVLGIHTIQSAAKSHPSIIASTIEALKPVASQIMSGGASTENPLNSFAPNNQFSDMTQRIINFRQGQPNQPGQTLLQAGANHPDTAAGITANLIIPGSGLLPMAARTAAQVGATALNPNATGKDMAWSGGIQAALEALPYGLSALGSTAKSLLAKLSGVDQQAIQKLYDNPSLLFTGPSKEEAQALYAATAEKAGLSPEISDQLLNKAGGKWVNNVVNTLKDEMPEGFSQTMVDVPKSEVPTQTVLDAKQKLDDLINAAKKAGENQAAKGWLQRKQFIMQVLQDRIPNFSEANSTYADAMTRDQFMSVLPTNANGAVSPTKAGAAMILANLAKGHISPGAAITGLATASPIVQGAAISGAGTVANIPRAIPRTGLQVLRQYIQQQQNR